jgi:hypothetical protein
VKLDVPSGWTSTFSLKGSKDSGLILISGAGDVEFRYYTPSARTVQYLDAAKSFVLLLQSFNN